MPHKDFDQPYDQHIEDKIYKQWEKSGFFAPEHLPGKRDESFCIIMPPTNANGSLHVGHAVGMTLEDLMVRYYRLKGKKVLWLPGADHAGFETQVVYEKKLEKEGTSRFKILQEKNGRKKLWKKIWDFTQENKKNMESQVKQLGASCDWSRETFTLDPGIVKIVYKTFKQLHDDGFIYRAKRIVNWCVKHQTSLSDLEIKWNDQDDKLYYVRYKLDSRKEDKYISIATVRPETIPGDVAIAVNPSDARYKSFVGKKVIEPITKRVIPVVADKEVDKEFGTGALKITPAHDPLDFEIGQRHDLQVIETLGFDGRFNAQAGPLEGMKVNEAREKSIEILKENGAFEKEEAYQHQVGTCYKCRNALEPMVLDQWFIDLTDKGKKAIVEPAVAAIKKGTVRIVPDFQKKIFLHWMENIRDWNISRQIVWGIPIPAWYCDECDGVIVHIEESEPKKCKCGNTSLRKDGDVFDTWFSSGQWPFATLQVNNSEEFYPTSVMETGYDILFFWVARMMMMGLYVTGKVPFETVYLHGLVRDKDKQKMSKSKGNVVDPLSVVSEFGADALRMALIVGNSPGQDVIYDESKIKGYRNFSNKLWNIARFIVTHYEKYDGKSDITSGDERLIKEIAGVKKAVEEDIEKYRFSQAAETAYHYVWHRLADELIEEKKAVLFDDDADAAKQESARKVLFELLVQSLIVLHPFMPFVTEAIYQRLPDKPKEFLMVENWDTAIDK